MGDDDGLRRGREMNNARGELFEARLVARKKELTLGNPVDPEEWT